MTVDHQFRYVEDIEDGHVVGMVGMGWPVRVHVAAVWYVSSEVIKIHAGYMRDICGIHAGYMRGTCGTSISGVWGNVSMPSWRAAHLSGHPCPPCAEMGPLQHPPAPASSPLSWQGTCPGQGVAPARIQARPQVHCRARDTYPRMYPYVSDMNHECILCVMLRYIVS